MMSENPPMRYQIEVFDNDYPATPFTLDIMAQIILPTGERLCVRRQEDIERFLFTRGGSLERGARFIAESVANDITGEIHKDISERVYKALWEKVKPNI